MTDKEPLLPCPIAELESNMGYYDMPEHEETIAVSGWALVEAVDEIKAWRESHHDTNSTFNWCAARDALKEHLQHCPNTRSAPSTGDTLTIADYEEVLADHRRLVRELDVALNGEEGAAKQASLCDIVSQVKAEGIKSKPSTSDTAALEYSISNGIICVDKDGTKRLDVSALLSTEQGINKIKSIIGKNSILSKTDCEVCEGIGRIEFEPDSETNHPCDTCKPEMNKEWQNGYNAALTGRADDIRELVKACECVKSHFEGYEEMPPWGEQLHAVVSKALAKHSQKEGV